MFQCFQIVCVDTFGFVQKINHNWTTLGLVVSLKRKFASTVINKIQPEKRFIKTPAAPIEILDFH